MNKTELGKGCSGTVFRVDESELKWLHTHCHLPSSLRHVVKKVFFSPGCEAIAEFYFSRFLYERYPELFIQPLYFIHAESRERYDSRHQDCYILYMKEE